MRRCGASCAARAASTPTACSVWWISMQRRLRTQRACCSCGRRDRPGVAVRCATGGTAGSGRSGCDGLPEGLAAWRLARRALACMRPGSLDGLRSRRESSGARTRRGSRRGARVGHELSRACATLWTWCRRSRTVLELAGVVQIGCGRRGSLGMRRGSGDGSDARRAAPLHVATTDARWLTRVPIGSHLG